MAAPLLALLRGINVTGHHRVSMAELRDFAAGLGLAHPTTYLQSGNLLFRTPTRAAGLQAQLERGLKQRFGFEIPVVLCQRQAWKTYVNSNPFVAACTEEPNRVMLAASSRAPTPATLAFLEARKSPVERLAVAGGVLWIHYAGGSARSKLTPAVLDRAVGAPVTTRNFRTVLALDALFDTLAG